MGQPDLLERLGTAFANAYAVAANAGAKMRTVTDALESLREAMTPDADVFALWIAFDEQLGRAGLGPFRPAMSALHGQFKKCAIQQLLHAVEDAGAGEPAQGAAQWLLTAARCFGDYNWRFELFTALAEANLPVVQQLESPFCEHETVRRLALCVATNRWVETYDWFRFLARQPSFSDELRARMLVIAAEIQLFCFRQRTRARRLLEEAEKIAPAHPRVMVAWGEWHAEASTSASLKAAEQCFRKVISMRPRLADGYVNLGDLFERKGDLSATESQFQDAILNAPGMTDGYLRLLRLFCKGEWFVTRAERRADLHSRMLILDADEANYLVEEGDAARANRHWAEAQLAYRRAVELAPHRLNARTGLTYTWCDEAQNPETAPQRATECFAAMRQEAERALADFPNAPDVYWVFVWHAEGTKNWDEAIRYSKRIGELHPEWESTTRFRAAIALRHLGQIDRAEAELHQVLAIEPLHPSAAMELNEVGEAAYRNGDRAAAEQLFAEARQLGGDEAEYDYQNRLGNLHYWHGEYETAADYYRKAIAARPGEAVLHSNLALALEHLHTPGRQVIEWQEILAALTEAARLAPSIAEYPTRLSAARQKLDFLARYGESALAFKHAGTPIRVDVSPPLLAAVLKPDTQDLSAETLDRIKLMRERLRSQTGVHLPGVLFGELADTSAGQDMMQISFFDEPLKTSTVAAPPHPGATIDILMQQLEGEIRRQCECFVTHQETAFSLTECTEAVCTEIRRAPLQLTAFVKFLRARLKDGESIAETARLAERFSFKVPALPLPRDATPWSWETAPQATRIVVLLGPISPAQKIAIEADLEAARNSLLDYFGILVPRLEFRIDTGIPLHSFQFSIGDREFPPQQGLQQDEIWIAADPSSLPSEWKPRPWTVQGGTAGAICYATAEHIRTRFPEKLVLDGTDVTRLELGFQLGRNLDLCIDQAQVEHRLALITPSHPALVESARARFGLEELVVLLRERFMASVSLRNFPATLERFLIETPSPMAKQDDIESRIAK